MWVAINWSSHLWAYFSLLYTRELIIKVQNLVQESTGGKGTYLNTPASNILKEARAGLPLKALGFEHVQKHFPELGLREGSQLSRAKHRKRRGNQHGDCQWEIAILFIILQGKALPGAMQCTAKICTRPQNLIFKYIWSPVPPQGV